MSLERQVERGVEQRVPRANERRERLALRCDEVLLEGDALVAREDRLSGSYQSVSVANGRRDIRDLVAVLLALANGAPEPAEGLQEE